MITSSKTIKALGLSALASVFLFSLQAEESRRERPPHGGMLERLDTDGDKMVSKVEMLSHFDSIDTNGDGLLSAEEMKAKHEAMREKFEGMRRERGEQHKDKDPAERFAKADANGDGVISKDEFKGPEMMFSKIDANGDGNLSKEELMAMKGKMKEHMKGRKERKKDGEIQ